MTKINKKALAILSAGHLVTDVNQGALPALLPFFKEVLGLSYTTAGIILLSPVKNGPRQFSKVDPLA
jgi:FSR family fosmidomycin resistance protein-like MFS transporter